MTIEQPIFILGNIRSGTTILYDLLAVHPDVCWFSNYSNRFRQRAFIPLVHRLLDVPLVGRNLKLRIARNRRPRISVPWPDEGDEIYHAYAGFGAVRDGLETDITESMESRLKEKITHHLRYTGKIRFLSKETANNRRIGLLLKMFPDSYFVHVIRDGRAVAASTLKVPWWNSTHIWWLGYTAEEWERRGKQPIELAGLYWQRTVQEIRRQGALLGDRYMELRYEELVPSTRQVMKGLANFAGLTVTDGFLDLLPETLPDQNYKWRAQLSEDQKEALHRAVGEFLAELGYH